MPTLMHGERTGTANNDDGEQLAHSAFSGTANREGTSGNTPPPPSIGLTPYHFLNFSIIFAFGCWKAVASYHGQATLSTTLDMLVGTIFPLAMLILGLCASKCPFYFLWFFHFDLLALFRRFVQRALQRRASAPAEHSAAASPAEAVWRDHNVAMPVPSPCEFCIPDGYQRRGIEAPDYELRVSIGTSRRLRRGIMRRTTPSLQATLPLPATALG
ncbi:hypothetical protein BDW22DRAFT_1361215 [Trametopsis cervina]|nr:hypothetical protein BDW22DRAFT_1361215 [Trametopsis cervina]